MKIKEVSEKTGLTKKTIRFYEQEQLFQPDRQTINFREYRDYTENDVDNLKKISLLRNLYLSIEEIRVIQEEPDQAAQIFRDVYDRVKKAKEEYGRVEIFYSQLEFGEEPFLEQVYQKLEDSNLPNHDLSRDEVILPGMLILLPVIAVAMFPFLEELILNHSAQDYSVLPPYFLLFRFLLGGGLAYICLKSGSRDQPKSLFVSTWLWVFFLVVALFSVIFFQWRGSYSFLLGSFEIENMALVLGCYIWMGINMWNRRRHK